MRLIGCFLSLALAVGAGFAAGPDPGKRVVDQALEALGGDRFLNFRTRTTTGRVYTFFRDQLSGLSRARIVTEYLMPPPAGGLGVREREFLGKKGDYSYLFLPDKGYELTFRGARPVDDDVWDRYRRTTENDVFYLLKVRHGEPGMTYDFVASDVLLSRHVEIVDITDAQGRTVRVWFDHNSHFPVRQTFTWVDETSRQRSEETCEYDKYRDIGSGIYWPFTIERSRNGYKVFQVFADSVEASPEPPTHTFDLPAGTQILKK